MSKFWLLPPLPIFKLGRANTRSWAVTGLGAAAAQSWSRAVLTILNPPLLRTLAVPMESTDRGGKLRGRRYISRNINSTWSQHVLENCLQVNGRHVLLRTYDKGGLRRIISLDILKSMSWQATLCVLWIFWRTQYGCDDKGSLNSGNKIFTRNSETKTTSDCIRILH